MHIYLSVFLHTAISSTCLYCVVLQSMYPFHNVTTYGGGSTTYPAFYLKHIHFHRNMLMNMLYLCIIVGLVFHLSQGNSKRELQQRWECARVELVYYQAFKQDFFFTQYIQKCGLALAAFHDSPWFSHVWASSSPLYKMSWYEASSSSEMSWMKSLFFLSFYSFTFLILFCYYYFSSSSMRPSN